MTALLASKSSASELTLPLNGVDLWLCSSYELMNSPTSEDCLRAILSCYLGVPRRELCISRTQKGRPYLGGVHEGMLDFNLSHSGNYWLMALSSVGQVGVDIEYRESSRPLERLVHRFYTPEEARIFEALPESDRAQYFFDCWTLKEALAKAAGTTMFATISQAGFSIEGGRVCYRPKNALSPEPGRQFWLYEPRSNWHLALCLQDGPAAKVKVNVRQWDMQAPATAARRVLRARSSGFSGST